MRIRRKNRLRRFAKDNIKSHKLIKSGDLLDNMSMNTTEKDRTQVEVTIGPGKKQFYGMFHEYGTSKMKARPFLRPAYDENIEKVQEVIAEELEEDNRKEKPQMIVFRCKAAPRKQS